MSTLHSRYLAGDYIGVWQEIRLLQHRIHWPQYIDDITAVVTETMRRARHNVDLIIEHLQDDGYQFVWPGGTNYFADRSRWIPDAESTNMINFIDGLCGPIPLVISEWIRSVGDVNLVGNHPKWPKQDMLTDALVVEFEYKAWKAGNDIGKKHYKGTYNEWQDNLETYGSDEIGPFVLEFAPDAYTKVYMSGGTYGVIVPDNSADALVLLQDRKIEFVDYLRECFAWGGFPGFKDMKPGADNGVVAKLCKDLLDLQIFHF